MKITRKQLRKIIAEATKEEKDFGKASVAEYQTIGQAVEVLKKLKAFSRENQQFDTFIDTVQELPKQIPIVGTLKTIYDTTKRMYDTSKNKATNTNPDMIENFPLLDLFDIHPVFFEVLDGNLMEKIEDKYESEHLSNPDLAASIDTLPDINDYIQEYLLSNYGITFGKQSKQQPYTYFKDANNPKTQF